MARRRRGSTKASRARLNRMFLRNKHGCSATQHYRKGFTDTNNRTRKAYAGELAERIPDKKSEKLH
jgi:hypothetical protein